MSASSAISFVVREFKEMLPPTIFFAVGFNLVLLTTNLILDDYDHQFATYMVATTGALIVGKSVLVANAMPWVKRYDNAPLVWPVLYKSLFYFSVVFLVRFLEKLIEYVTHGGTIGGIADYVAEHFTWHRFLAIQIWIFALFVVYNIFNELNELFGDGELYRVLFTWRSSELKLGRRQRIRILTKLGHLADAHTQDEFRDPATRAHAQMLDLLRQLTSQEKATPSLSATVAPVGRPARTA